jgi:drug/metabolite transporter (DMT)-like permease
MMVGPGGPLSSSADSAAAEVRRGASRRKGIALMAACTVLFAAGQILIKMGADQLIHPTLWSTFVGFFTVPQLFAGYCLYAAMTVLFVFALKEGELSILYPIISLTYVWVAGLSVWFFHDSLNWLKLVGVVTIVSGVGVLGKDAHK